MLVRFYGISTLGYLMPNLVHTYVKYIICKKFLGDIFKRVKVNVFAHSSIVLSIAIDSINYKPIVCTKLNDLKYSYLTLIMLFNI